MEAQGSTCLQVSDLCLKHLSVFLFPKSAMKTSVFMLLSPAGRK